MTITIHDDDRFAEDGQDRLCLQRANAESASQQGFF
jgi:hypothetical protein